MESLLDAFRNGSYAPHGYCLLWQPGLVYTHVIADALIALSYFSIPIALILLVRQRKDLAFGWAFWCFATFILACGLTHVMSIWTLWQSVYGLEAFVKVVTAIASIATAILLWPLLPRVVALPSAEKLRAANAELATMIAERDAAIAQMREQVDQRERVEAALLQSQKLEAVGQLTGGIAHDFNNLLQAVAGNLELIARKPGDIDRVVRWSGSALDAVERGRALTGKLLAFSRKQRLELTSVPVREMLAGMRDLIDRAVAPLGRVEIMGIDPTMHVEADQLQLELAILNIAFNARDAMPEGGVLRISAACLCGGTPPGLPRGDWVALTLADTGTGMAPDVLERATEPFFTTKEVGKGTGMGLSMAFGVVSQSGGTLQIESSPGKGTAITMWLKVSHALPHRALDDASVEQWTTDFKGRRFVLVDDDAQVRDTLTEALRGAGAQVVEADSGEHGLQFIAAHRPDLLIVDFAMPGMNGSEVVRRAREIAPGLPAMLITGFAESRQLDEIEGQIAVLRKPFEMRVLFERIEQLMRSN
ncbi:MAG: ATP-binding protein [Pseudomonadota bacterium]